MAKASKSGLRYDDFIEKVRPNPKSTDELVMLQGYIGQSDLSDHVRIYFDATLSDFIELPEREICYADPVSSEENPLGGSRLWVRKTAVFTSGDPAHANRPKSSFLEGDLLKAFGGQAANFQQGLGNNLPSAFLEQGCVPYTEPFGVCNVQTNQRWCQLADPTTGTPTIQNPSCLQTCPQSPCIPPSRHPYAICWSVNNVGCELQVGFPPPPTVWASCHTCLGTCNFKKCPLPPISWKVCVSAANCRLQATAACTGGVVNDYLAIATVTGYTGGFNPYATGY